MKTHVLIILDKSWSMNSCREATIVGFNEKVSQIKLNAEEQDIRVSFLTFNGHVYEHAWMADPAELPELTADDYRPEGSTAMFDAVGYGVTRLREDTADELGDVAYLVEIISDGENTDLGKYSPEAVAELIQGCQATKKWTFAYMGSNQDLSQVAKKLNIPIGNVAQYASVNNKVSLRGMRMANAGTENFLRARSKGLCAGTEALYSSSGIADFTEDLDEVIGKVSGEINHNVSPLTALSPRTWSTGGGSSVSSSSGLVGNWIDLSAYEPKKKKKTGAAKE